MVSGRLAPWNRHTGIPKAAGFRHCTPDLFDLAWHCKALWATITGRGGMVLDLVLRPLWGLLVGYMTAFLADLMEPRRFTQEGMKAMQGLNPVAYRG